MSVHTPRLLLVPATLPAVRAAVDGPAALARALGAGVTAEYLADWSPEILAFVVDQLEKDPTIGGWGMWFVISDEPPAPPTLIGTVGCKGRPGADGAVEVGYGIIPSRQRRGYATEALRGLLGWVFTDPHLNRAIAHTFELHHASVGVLRNCGFELLGPGFEKVDESERMGRGELVLFGLTRAAWAATNAATGA